MAPNLAALFKSHDAPPDADDTTRHLFSLINENFDDSNDDSNKDKGINIADFSTLIQYGGKAGQSLYTHVMDLVYALHQIFIIIPPASDEERRVLYVAAILHDINKYAEESAQASGLARLATKENIDAEIQKRRFDRFFPDYARFLEDIATLIQAHGAHSTVGGSVLIRSATRFGLGQDRVQALIHIIRAVDTLELSDTLREDKHKNAFLSDLNAFLTQTGQAQQYEFHTHQLVEQRGLLTNILQNALSGELARTAGWQPFLLYPDGVVYLAKRGSRYQVDVNALARAVKNKFDSLTLADPATLIEQTPQGIKFKSDALKSGLSPAVLWNAVRNVVSRRKFKRDELDAKGRERTSETLRKSPPKTRTQTDELRTQLASKTPLVKGTDTQMRAAELLRTYYILLTTYAPQIDDPWARLYRLAELPEENDWYYNCFDARYDRPYFLADALSLTDDEIAERLVQDMSDALPGDTAADAEADPVWVEYLTRYLLIDGRPMPGEGNWTAHLQHYVANNHEQCVHCSAPFPTIPWVAGDVRTEDLKVQAFSNRLGAGGGEPKKNICPVCRMQFLVEKLNYTEVRGESQLYLHFYPYKFMPKAFAEALGAELAAIRNSDETVAALHIDAEKELEAISSKRPLRLNYITTTKQGKQHPYGIYCPMFSETIGGMITLPINGAGDNDTARYLYVLTDALVWARALNMKVVISKNATPPLPPADLPDVFLDMIPLGFAGLLPEQNYAYDLPSMEQRSHIALDAPYNGMGQRQANGGGKGGRTSRHTLLGALKALYRAGDLVGGGLDRQDTVVKLIRAMSDGPLGIFPVADREMEKADLSVYKGRDALPYLRNLSFYVADYTGVSTMSQTHNVLQQMAEIAWKNYLRGSSLKRSPLLYALSEVFDHMQLISPQLDVETIKAATCREMFDHLDRISTSAQGRGRTTQDAVQKFVELWYNGIVDGVYGGNYRRVLQDEKLLKAAYLFYVQAQIPVKHKDSDDAEATLEEQPAER